MGRTESPSVIAEQRSLIEDLAHSNQEYMHKFEKLKLGVEESTVEDMYDASSIGAIEREPSTSTRSLPGALTRKSEKIKFATGGTPLEDEDNAPSLGSRKLTTARRSSPKAQISATRTLATPPNASINNVFINTSVQTNIAMPPVQERGIPTIEAPIGFDQEVVFKQLEHYSMLITNLLKEVDEAQYKITFKSRLRVKGGIAGLHEGERQELEKTWGCTALQSAEQRLESLVEGLGELPRMNSFAARDTVQMSSPDNMSRTGTLPSLATEPGPDSREQDEAAVWISQAKSDGRRPYVNPGTWSSRMQIPVSNAVTKESQSIDVPEKSPYEWMARSYASIVPLADSENYTEISDPDLLDLMEDPRSEESPTPVVDVNAKPAEEGSIKQGNAITSGKMKNQVLARKDVKGLALREHIRPSSHARKVEDLDHSPKYSQIPEGFSMPIDFGEDQRVKTQPANKEDGNVLGEHVCQSQEELNAKLASKRGWKAADNLESTKEGDPTAQTTNSQTVSPVDLMVNLESASVIAPEAALPLKKIVTNCSPVWVNDNEVPIVPFSDREWGEIINMQIPSLSHRDTLDDYDDEVDFANVDDAKSGKNAESSRRDTDHVNLGLADMEVVDRLVFLWTTVKPS